MSQTRKYILISVAVLIVVAGSSLLIREFSGPNLARDLKASETEAKKSLPLKIDDVTTLVNLKYESGKTTYWYVIDTTRGTLSAQAIEQRIQSGLCANADTARTIKEDGFRYEYHYVTAKRAALADFTISKCR
ncbi:MAG: hypothetical protein HY243_15785 [Proteobacteria bacterium]|nr:hypothetical protein [Pseudomonadota bacterium]